MEPLEVVLRKIEDLRIDLSAVIVIQEEEGHSGTVQKKRARITYADVDPWDVEYEEGWIIDKPAVKEPDMKKRQVARQALQKVYDSSNWYSACYSAGIALEFPDGKYYRGRSKVDSEVESWFNELNNQIGSQEPETRFKAIKDSIYLHRIRQTNGFPIRLLEQLLKKAYKGSANKTMTEEIGKELDYSPLRVWFHNLFR